MIPYLFTIILKLGNELFFSKMNISISKLLLKIKNSKKEINSNFSEIHKWMAKLREIKTKEEMYSS